MVLGIILTVIGGGVLVYWVYSSVRSIVAAIKKRRADRRPEGESDGEK